MKIISIPFVLAAVAIALSGCNRAGNDRTTSIPGGADRGAIVQQTPQGLSAPAAPAERGPVPPNANAVAPGTNAAVALANEPSANQGQTAKPDAAEAVSAQEAAARASDTASADAAKNATLSAANAAEMSGTARDTAANSPRHGTLTKNEESNQMPKAGQANNYSSPALEKDSGR